MKRIYVIVIFLLATGPQAFAAVVPATNPQLLAARERLHRAADQLDAMSEQQWIASQTSRTRRNPAGIIPLSQARQEAHTNADAADGLSDQDWADKQGKTSQSLQDIRQFVITHNGKITPADVSAITGKNGVPQGGAAAPEE